MKVNELRVGNFLNPKVNEHILNDEIHIVEPTTLMCILNLVDSKGIEFVPILLTKEWLLKFGFKHIYDDWYYNCILTINTSKHIANFGGNTISNIKYVHQLQNLVFVLTGEELTFNI